MKGMLKIRLLTGVVALIAASLIFIYIRGIEESRPNYIKTYVAAINISENTQIQENMVKEKQILSSDYIEGAIKDKKDIIGKYASVNITKNEQFLGVRLLNAAPDSDTQNAFKYKIPDGLTTITVKTDAESAVAGLLKVGDKVDILAYYPKKVLDDAGKEKTINVEKYIAKNIEIAALDKDIVKSAQVETKEKSSTSKDTKNSNTINFKSVTLFAEPKLAQALNYCNNAGVPLTFTLSSPNSDTEIVTDEFTMDELATYTVNS